MHRMATHVQIRRATPRDFDALGVVFHDAVSHAFLYSEAQRTAWSPGPRSGEQWAKKLGSQMVWQAESEGKSLGFMTLTQEGGIDLAFIRGEAQGRGIFTALFIEVFGMARQLAMPKLWTDASLHAMAPFTKVGFHIAYNETVELNGEKLSRSRMEMVLNA
jgi:putative acetyltransferase